MLSMKTLRVAIAAMGSALLFASGLTMATVQHLDGRGAAAPPVLRYAQELLTLAPGQALKAVPVFSPSEHTAHKLVVTLGRLLEAGDPAYVRLELGGGMVFAKHARNLAGDSATSAWKYGGYPMEPASIMCDHDNDDGTPNQSVSVSDLGGTVLPTTHSSGGDVGQNYVVFRLDIPGEGDGIPSVDNASMYDGGSGQIAPGDDSCVRPAQPTKIWVDIFQSTDNGSYLQIPAGPGSYSASISLHSDPDDAQTGTNRSSALYGMATIMQAVNGLDVEVKAMDKAAVAHVGTTPKPFLWFKDGDDVKSEAVLGYAKADIAEIPGGLRNPTTGATATDAELVPPESLTFRVEGDFSIGAFHLADAPNAASAACPPDGAPSATAPVMGNLKATEDGPADERMLAGQDAGQYFLCVNVDTQGPNTTPIPAGRYNATITSGTGALAKDLESGVIGEIKRNGTTVKLTYLTTYEHYNQRIIIVNDGANDASYDIGPFATEEGTMATPKAKASGIVPAGGQVILKVSDVVDFAGMTRGSATLSMNADVDDVQVATTIVNLNGGGTDTVVYASEGGAEVN